MSVKERLTEYLRTKKISKSAFGRDIGVSSAYIASIRKSIQPDKLQRIALKYPDLNTVWLLTGEGEMLKTDTMKATNSAEQSNDYRLVPMYNLDARGGFGENDAVDVPEYIVDYIPFKDAKSEDICVPIFGNSMAPTYCAGATVLLHPVRRWQEFLELGQVYMIVLQDNRRIIKELRSSQEDRKTQYLCVSHNPTFDPVELPKSMIKQVFLVKAVYSKTSM
jgi:phage repressor protein C with HTH and peptisase S24 domain